MFDTIHWNEYFLTLALLLGGYYVSMLIYFYRKEVDLWVKGLKVKDFAMQGHPSNPSNSNQSTASKAVIETEQLPENPLDLMGKAMPTKLPESEHVKISEIDQLSFSEGQEEQAFPKSQNTPSPDTLLLGAIADLLDEVKTLVGMIKECEGTKAESISLFQSLLTRYAELSTTRFRQVINLYILDLCKDQGVFEVSLAEINAWWP